MRILVAVLLLVTHADAISAIEVQQLHKIAVPALGNSIALDRGIGIASAGDDNAAYLFDAKSGGILHRLTGGQSFGSHVAIEDGKAIVTYGFARLRGVHMEFAEVYDVVTGERVIDLDSPDVTSEDLFISPVGIDEGIALVGAASDDNEHASDGSAYLFDIDSGEQLAKLTAGDPDPHDLFGFSVDLDDNLAIVGAAQDSDIANWAGSAYIFDVTTGEQLFKITAEDATSGDRFGEDVRIQGQLAIVGASTLESQRRLGAVYVFNGTTGEQLLKLNAETPSSRNDQFGRGLDVDGNLALIGASFENDLSGAAYLFDLTTGRELAKITPNDPAARSEFGNSVALHRNIAIIGASAADAVYVFSIPEPTSWTLSLVASLGLASSRLRYRRFPKCVRMPRRRAKRHFEFGA